MVREQALRKLGGDILVSPEEPTISATEAEYPFPREFTESSPNALSVEPDAIGGVAAGRAAGAFEAPTALSAPPIEPRRAAERLALAARAAWTRGDAPALTRAGRHLFRLAGSGAGLPVAELDGTAAGNVGVTQELAREVLALGDLAAGRLAAPPAAVTLPWAEDPALWLPPRLVPELLGEDFVTYRSCAGLLERLRAGGPGAGARRAAERRAGGGEGRALPVVLGQLTSSAIALGRWSTATEHAAEGLALARIEGQAVEAAGLLAQLAWIAAARGRVADCRRLAAEALAIAAPRGYAPVAAMVTWALGLLELGLGRPARALDRLAPLASSSGSTPVLLLATADLVEAAVRSGRPAAAEPLLAQLDRWVELAGPAWALATTFRCRGLLAAGEEAEICFQAALDAGAASARPFAQARTELDYGVWLRRNRRWGEASARLRVALENFQRLGTSPWIGRTRVELAASGFPAGPVGIRLLPHDRRAGVFRGGGVRPAARGRC